MSSTFVLYFNTVTILYYILSCILPMESINYYRSDPQHFYINILVYKRGWWGLASKIIGDFLNLTMKGAMKWGEQIIFLANGGRSIDAIDHFLGECSLILGRVQI